MTRLAVVVVLVLALSGSASAQPGSGVKGKSGKELYAAYCLSCHGVDGSGVSSKSHPTGVLDVSGLGPPLTDVGALGADFYLTTGYMPLGDPHEQPRRTESPFDKREIAALVDYVASFGHGPLVPKPHPERSDVSRGLALFTEHCAGCHQVVAEGGIVTGGRVPPLNRASSVEIAEAVRIGPVPEGLVTWLIAAVALVGCCLVIGRKFQQ